LWDFGFVVLVVGGLLSIRTACKELLMPFSRLVVPISDPPSLAMTNAASMKNLTRFCWEARWQRLPKLDAKSRCSTKSENVDA